MSELQAKCPHCQVRMKLKDPALAGKKVRCPKCREPFTVPAPASSAARPLKAAAANEDIDFLVPDKSSSKSAAAGSPAGDDDWLSALDALPAEADAPLAAGPPPVAGKRKRKQSGGTRKRGLRDADGELPIWVHTLLMIGTGLVAGIFTTAIWAGIIYRTGFSSHYFALIVGTAVGLGVRLGASKWDYGWGPAITASIIAFVSIMGGKIIGVNILMAETRAEERAYLEQTVKLMEHENYLICLEADQVWMEQYEAAAAQNGDAAGDALLADAGWDVVPLDDEADWGSDPGGVSGPEDLPDAYPPKIWAEGKKRWAALAPEEQAERRKAVQSQIAVMKQIDPRDGNEFDQAVDIRGMGPMPTGTRVLSPLDFVFAVLAIIAAFRLAAGFVGMDGEED